MKFPFEISAFDGEARTGVLKTARGDIRTPGLVIIKASQDERAGG